MKALPPIPEGFTSVVASREFVVVRGAVSTRMLVEIGAPVQDVETVDGFDWRCPVRYSEDSRVRERQVCGVDAYQALELALKLVGIEVSALAKAEGTVVLLFGERFDGSV